jgi:hypothetical protein
VQVELELQAKEIMAVVQAAVSFQVAAVAAQAQLAAQEAHQPVMAEQDLPLALLAYLLTMPEAAVAVVMAVLLVVLAVQVEGGMVLAIQLLVQQAPLIQAAVAVAEVKLAERLMAVRVLS